MIEAAYRLMDEYEEFYRRRRPSEDLLFHVRLIKDPFAEFAIETLSDLLWNSIMFACVWDELSFNI